MGLLAKRNVLNQIRLPQSSYIKLFGAIFISLICCLIYFDVPETKAGIQDRQGALFFTTLTMGFGAVQGVALIFPQERPVFMREVNNNMYSVSAYFWAKILSEFPLTVIIPTVQIAITYFAIGFNSNLWYKFPLTVLIAILIYSAFGGLGYILGTAISNKKVVAILTPIVVVPNMLFAGFFVNQDNIPVFLFPLHNISIFKYGFQALMLNEF